MSFVIDLPGDKSLSHRALLFSSLLAQPSDIYGLLPSADVNATQRCLVQLGTVFEGIATKDTTALRVLPHPWQEPDDILNVDNSGTSIRLLAGLLSAQPFVSILTGDAAIRRRPMGRVIQPLQAMGAAISGRSSNTLAPLIIQPGSGRLSGIQFDSPVSSAQVKSAILLAGLYAETPVLFREPVRSRDHTERFFQAAGLDLSQDEAGWWALAPRQIERLNLCPGIQWTIPGDISSAAFFLVLTSLIPGLQVDMPNVGLNPARIGIISTLQAMGAQIAVINPRDCMGEPVGDITIVGTGLSGDILLDGKDIPGLVDEIPVLMIAGALMDGRLTVKDAEELRMKESDRLAAMGNAFEQLGIAITMQPDGFILHGKPNRKVITPSRALPTYHDHRIVMSLAVLNALVDPTHEWPLEGPEWVNVSFPGFFKQLNVLKKTVVGE